MKRLLTYLLFLDCFCFSASVSICENFKSGTIDDFMIVAAKAGDDILQSGQFSLRRNLIYEESSDMYNESQKSLKDNENPASETVITKDRNVTVYLEKRFEDIKVYSYKRWDNIYSDGSIENIDEKRAYNGEHTDYLQTSVSNVRGERSVAKFIPEGIKMDQYDPRHYGYFICGTPVSDFLTGKFGSNGLSGIRLVKEEIEGGVVCSVVEGTVAGADSTITAWLAQDMFYRPVKVVVDTPKRTIKVETTLIKYNDYLYFPESISLSGYFSDNAGEPKEKKNEYMFEIDTVDLNIDIPDEYFSIEFQTGKNIQDYRLFQIITYGLDPVK